MALELKTLSESSASFRSFSSASFPFRSLSHSNFRACILSLIGLVVAMSEVYQIKEVLKNSATDSGR